MLGCLQLSLLGANFRKAILDEIVLGKSEMKGIYFNQASIKNAKLEGAILTGCDFSEVNFSSSSLKNANLSYANLTKAKLINMDLTTVNFEGADLTKASLKGSTISQVQLDSIYNKQKIKISKTKVLYEQQKRQMHQMRWFWTDCLPSLWRGGSKKTIT